MKKTLEAGTVQQDASWNANPPNSASKWPHASDLLGVMSEDLLRRYKGIEDIYMKFPTVIDAEIRRTFRVPENRYYRVGMFPRAIEGHVFLGENRVVPTRKISKSDSHEN